MRIRALLVPYDSGRRGERTGAGPELLLRMGAGSGLRALGHDVTAEHVETDAAFATEIGTSFDLHRRLAERVHAAVAEGALPVVLSGNCGSAIGAVSGLDGDVGVVWLDAHADLNTPETSGSGFLDGMCLATLTGRCWRPLAARVPGFRAVGDERVVLAAVRDVDPAEEELLASSGISVVRGAAIRAEGLAAALGPALDALAGRVRRVYLHLDLDLLDPELVGRANAFAAPGGLTADGLVETVRLVRARFEVAAVGITSYDPACDVEGGVFRAAMRALEELVEGPHPARQASPPSPASGRG